MRIVVPLVFVISQCLLGAESNAASIPNRAVYTNKTQFRIPYRYDEEEIRRLNSKEIRLYASLNFGGQWQHVSSVAPQAGRFEFQAAQDGEYWFAVKTLGGNGRLHPEGAITEAGLKVIIDTVAPQFDIALRQSAPGKIQMSWSASDPYLDPTKLRLEYIQAGLSNWQQVSVTPQARGQTTWSVANGGLVSVRGTIRDKSQNVARSQVQVTIERADQAVPKPFAPNFRQPIAQSDGLTVTDSLTPLPQRFAPQVTRQVDPFSLNPFAAASSRPGPTSTVIVPAPRNQLISSGTSALPLDTRTHNPQPLRSQQNTRSFNVQRRSGRHRAIRSRKFEIAYRFDDVGPSGVSRVELFVTQDDGQKWWKYGDDTDRQSPFHVEVPSDGTYGFVLRVRSGAGLADDPPQPDEKPSIVIVVDQSPPVVELMPLQQGEGASLNKILIRWKITDQNPAEKPISLSYSARASGPWEPITGWLPDTGSYIWKVTSGVPSKLYIRLIARDAVGNMARTETPNPVLVDLTKPSARIVDVEVSEKQF